MFSKINKYILSFSVIFLVSKINTNYFFLKPLKNLLTVVKLREKYFTGFFI